MNLKGLPMFLRSRWILTKPQPISVKAAPANRSPSITRFSSVSAEPSEKMEEGGEDRSKTQSTTTTTAAGDIMTDSFGHGYSTRSDDDGFGGIYGGNQSLLRDDGEKSVAEEDAKKQGSEVKQREKGRHQAEIDDN